MPLHELVLSCRGGVCTNAGLGLSGWLHPVRRWCQSVLAALCVCARMGWGGWGVHPDVPTCHWQDAHVMPGQLSDAGSAAGQAVPQTWSFTWVAIVRSNSCFSAWCCASRARAASVVVTRVAEEWQVSWRAQPCALHGRTGHVSSVNSSRHTLERRQAPCSTTACAPSHAGVPRMHVGEEADTLTRFAGPCWP